MNYFIVYLLVTLPKIGIALILIPTAVVSIHLLYYIVKAMDFDPIKLDIKLIVASIIIFMIGIFIPSENGMLKIIGVGAVYEAATSESGKDIGEALVKKLKDSLDVE